MSFKNILTLLVFMLFIALGGYELMTNVRHSAKQDVTSIIYTSGMEEEKKEVTQETFDINKILEDSSTFY